MFFNLMTYYSPDFSILDWLNHHCIPHSIPFFQLVSLTATYISVALVTGILILYVIKRSGNLKKKFLILLAVLLVSSLTIYLLKTFIQMERPFLTHPEIVKRSTGGGSSFPSGHTLEAFAIAVAFTKLFGKKWSVILFLWAGVVAYSRLVLGVHYPSDVFAGLLIGCFVGWVIPGIVKRCGFISAS